jgi:hypothetical protein
MIQVLHKVSQIAGDSPNICQNASSDSAIFDAVWKSEWVKIRSWLIFHGAMSLLAHFETSHCVFDSVLLYQWINYDPAVQKNESDCWWLTRKSSKWVKWLGKSFLCIFSRKTKTVLMKIYSTQIHHCLIIK